MKNGFESITKFETITTVLLVLTVAAVGFFHTFKREIKLTPRFDWSTQTSDDRSGGGSSIVEDLSGDTQWKFSYATQPSSVHEYAIFLLVPNDLVLSTDLSWFEKVNVKARVQGDSVGKFLIFLRDRGNHLAGSDDLTARKYNQACFELGAETQTVEIDRDQFYVPQWWIEKHGVIPEDFSTSFANFDWIEIAVCHPEQGRQGEVVIEEISFSGSLLPAAQFYRGLSVIWAILLVPMALAIYRKWQRHRSLRRIRMKQLALSRADGADGSELDADTVEVESCDPLTGLSTLFGLQDEIADTLGLVRNGEVKVHIILFDVDDLGLLNDAKGRSEGDKLLQHIAQTASNDLGQHSFCRWKDDKFLLICKGQTREEAQEFADGLRAKIESETAGTCSFGNHQLNPINTFEESIARAFRCVRDAKASGKNTVALFGRSTPILSLATLALQENSSVAQPE